MLQLDHCCLIFSDVVKTDNNDNEKKSKSSSLKDDRLGDLSTSKIKLEIESSARVVDASKTSHMGSSSLTEKQQKQMKTGSSESDEIIIILPPQKPQPPEIIIYDDEETIPVGNEAKVSR